MAIWMPPFVPPGLASPQPPPEIVTSSVFADGSSSATIEFAGCSDRSRELRFESHGRWAFDHASIRVGFAPNSTATQARVQIDVGSDGILDVNTTLVTPSLRVLQLGSLGFNVHLAYWGSIGSYDIPARVTACAPSGTAVFVFDEVEVAYWKGGSPYTPPNLVREPPPLQVLAGAEVARALDLTPYFSDPEGEPLKYYAWAGQSAPNDPSGVRIAVEGSIVRVVSENSSFWGNAAANFFVVDPHGLVARSLGTSVYVRPRAPTVPTNTTLADGGGIAGSGLRYSQQFRLPADATIQSASFTLKSDDPASVMEQLATTITVESFREVLATVVPATLPLKVVLNTSVLNGQLRSQHWDGVSVIEVEVTADSHGGITRVAVENLSIVYTRYPAVPLPVVAGILINGTNITDVVAGVPLPYSVLVAGPFFAYYEFQWFVDGVLTREGLTAYEMFLPPGDHTVEIRITNETTTTSYSILVHAEDKLPGTADPIGGAASWVAVGAVALGGAALAIWYARFHPLRHLGYRRRGPP